MKGIVAIAWGAVALLGFFDGLLGEEPQPTVRLWDTGKAYAEKDPMGAAWKDKANWTAVPHNSPDYKPRGDLMLEGESFYLFLFSNKDDSVDLMAKVGAAGVKSNEIYKVHDTGLRNFGQGTIAVKILKHTAEEILVEHAGEGRRHGKPEPVVTTYRILAGKPWLEVRPVERVNQQGMHGKSRMCAFAKKEGEDFILDSKREPFTGEVNVPAPQGSIGIINFSRKFRTDYDFMWFMAFPPGAEKHPLTYLGFHADPFWEDARSDRPSVGAQYAYLDKGGVFIAVLNNPDNWKREEVGREGLGTGGRGELQGNLHLHGADRRQGGVPPGRGPRRDREGLHAEDVSAGHCVADGVGVPAASLCGRRRNAAGAGD